MLILFDTCRGYYSDIPADTMLKVSKSALYSFGFTAILMKYRTDQPINLMRPLANAGLAALSSLIYSLITPLFNFAFEDNRLVFHRELIKHYIVQCTSAIVACFLIGSKINLLAVPLIESIPVNLFKSFFEYLSTMHEFAGDPATASHLRQKVKQMGLDITTESGSLFILFDTLKGFPV